MITLHHKRDEQPWDQQKARAEAHNWRKLGATSASAQYSDDHGWCVTLDEEDYINFRSFV